MRSYWSGEEQWVPGPGVRRVVIGGFWWKMGGGRGQMVGAGVKYPPRKKKEMGKKGVGVGREKLGGGRGLNPG